MAACPAWIERRCNSAQLQTAAWEQRTDDLGEIMRGVKRYEVALEPHNDSWAREFENTRKEISSILGANGMGIHHIGSTAVKGIVAKPILDVGVFVRKFDEINITGMQSIGYDYCGESDVSGRCLFVMRKNGDLSTHHIHCFPENHSNLIANILFRNFLNEHPKYAKQYNDLKLRLYALYPKDRAKYTNGKEEFIKMIGDLAKGMK
jgi:GrpB-like predicted nucleotidyltransferase (UPF0157 family)